MRRRFTLTLALVVCLATYAVAAGGKAPDRARASRATPPVVMVVFDEFPSLSLLDARGRIDPIRYPNFAQLAQDGDWFPNATASVDETGRAMSTLMTGNQPARKRPTTTRENPHNLFTWLGSRYRRDVSEEVTDFCPARMCPGAHRKTRSEILHELAGGRRERFRGWVHSIKASSRPTLYFKHALLPHVPLRYLPSGRLYSSNPHEVIDGVSNTFFSRWLVNQAYQRHLLQLGATDRLLGELLARLRGQGIYHRALIVITADNGEGFGAFGNRHEVNRRNAVRIALTPLFIKRPDQQRGRIVRRHVRMHDVLPSMAHVLNTRLGWRTQGASVYGRAARRIPSGTRVIQRSGRVFRFSFAELRREAKAALRLKLQLFGSGIGPPGLYALGPFDRLLGSVPSAWPSASPGKLRAKLIGGGELSSVRLRSDSLPAMLNGRLSGGGRKGHRLAFALNGRIVATAPSFRLRGDSHEYFTALLPEAAFRDGANRVAIYAISPRKAVLRLERLG